MSGLDHTPARPPQPEARIGVRALLSAGDQRAQVALRLPGAAREIRLTPEEAAELAGRLLSMTHMARYDAAIYAALGQQEVERQAHEAILKVLIAARETITDAHRRYDEEWTG